MSKSHVHFTDDINQLSDYSNKDTSSSSTHSMNQSIPMPTSNASCSPMSHQVSKCMHTPCQHHCLSHRRQFSEHKLLNSDRQPVVSMSWKSSVSSPSMYMPTQRVTRGLLPITNHFHRYSPGR
jgi:hypothetical protein